MASSQGPAIVTDPTAADAPSARAVLGAGGFDTNIWVAIILIICLLVLVGARVGFKGALGD